MRISRNLDGENIETWLDDIYAGSGASTRWVSTFERDGSLCDFVNRATVRGLHLIQFEDERGQVTLIGSKSPFVTLC